MSLNIQHATQRKYKTRWLAVTTAVIFTLLISTLGTVGANVWILDSTLKANSVDLEPVSPEVVDNDTPEPPEMFTSITDSFTMVIVGNDSGDGDERYGVRDHTLNDVNIVLHIAPGWKQATAISFPRDLIVRFPECTNPETGETVPGGVAKINTALHRGGLPCVVNVLSSLTDAPINNALMVGFNGVVELSNAVGGVDVCLTEPINDKHANLFLEAGNHTLQGDQALGFLRTRYGVGDGSDLGRISNQQIFLSSLLRKLKSEETLTNPQRILSLADAVSKNTILSSNLADVGTLGNIAFSLRGLDLSQVNFVQVPTGYVENGVELNDSAAEELFTTVFNNQTFQLSGGTGPGETGSVKQDQPAVEPEKEPLPPLQLGDVPQTEAEQIQWYKDLAVAIKNTPPVVAPEPEQTLTQEVTGQNATEATCTRGYSG